MNNRGGEGKIIKNYSVCTWEKNSGSSAPLPGTSVRGFSALERRNSSNGSTALKRTKHPRFYRFEKFFGAQTPKFPLRIYRPRAHKTQSFLFRLEDFIGARKPKFFQRIYHARAHKTPSFLYRLEDFFGAQTQIFLQNFSYGPTTLERTKHPHFYIGRIFLTLGR